MKKIVTTLMKSAPYEKGTHSKQKKIRIKNTALDIFNYICDVTEM